MTATETVNETPDFFSGLGTFVAAVIAAVGTLVATVIAAMNKGSSKKNGITLHGFATEMRAALAAQSAAMTAQNDVLREVRDDVGEMRRDLDKHQAITTAALDRHDRDIKGIAEEVREFRSVSSGVAELKSEMKLFAHEVAELKDEMLRTREAKHAHANTLQKLENKLHLIEERAKDASPK